MREIFKKSRGFGIIEAIIALAILGVALSAMMQSTTIMFNALKTDNNIIRDNTYCENIFNNLGEIYDDTFDIYENSYFNYSGSDISSSKIILEDVNFTVDSFTSFENGILSMPSVKPSLEVFSVTDKGNNQYELTIKNPLRDNNQISPIRNNTGIYTLNKEENFLDYSELFDLTTREEIFQTSNSGFVVNDKVNVSTTTNRDLTVMTKYNYCVKENGVYKKKSTVAMDSIIVGFKDFTSYPEYVYPRTPYSKSPMQNSVIIQERESGVEIADFQMVCLPTTNNCNSPMDILCVENRYSILTSQNLKLLGNIFFIYNVNNVIKSIDDKDPVTFLYLEKNELDGFRVTKNYTDSYEYGGDLIKLEDDYKDDLNSSLTNYYSSITDEWRTLAKDNLRHTDVDITIGCEMLADDGQTCYSSSRVATCQINNNSGSSMKFSKIYRKDL